jgi:hypothetical protein
MKERTFTGSYWGTAKKEEERVKQQARDSLNALSPEEIRKVRQLLWNWNRVADMTLSEFIFCILDKTSCKQLDI